MCVCACVGGTREGHTGETAEPEGGGGGGGKGWGGGSFVESACLFSAYLFTRVEHRFYL